MSTVMMLGAFISQGDFNELGMRFAVLLAALVGMFVVAILAIQISKRGRARAANSAPDAGSDHTSSTSWLNQMKSEAGVTPAAPATPRAQEPSVIPPAVQPSAAPARASRPTAPPAQNPWVEEPDASTRPAASKPMAAPAVKRPARPATQAQPAGQQQARPVAQPQPQQPRQPAPQQSRPPAAPAASPFGNTSAADDIGQSYGSD